LNESVAVVANSDSTRQSLSLEDLIALNDEMVALVRAGVPLGMGLTRLSPDLSGRRGRIAKRLGEELARGVSFPVALNNSGVNFPPVYRAVVQAGIRSGRLAAALEAVARSARRLAEGRRMVAAALVYPLFLFLIAWVLFLFFVNRLSGAFLRILDSTGAPTLHFLEAVHSLRSTMDYWGPLVPNLVIFAFVWWAYHASRATLLQPVRSEVLFCWIPWLGAMVRTFRQAALAEMLHVLIDHEVPLPEAIRLAAETTATPKARKGAEQIASAIERGEKLGGSVGPTPGFSPVLEWLLRSGHDRGTLNSAVRHAADAYQRRGQQLALSAQLYLAPLMTLLIGGGVTVAYAGMTFGVWLTLLNSIGRMVGHHG
jgi:type II secretory pathway component PulF